MAPPANSPRESRALGQLQHRRPRPQHPADGPHLTQRPATTSTSPSEQGPSRRRKERRHRSWRPAATEPPRAETPSRPKKGRNVATWTSQEGNAPPRCYFSAAAWSHHQLLIEKERVPWFFRGRTISEQHARFPDGVAAAEPGANYCGTCGLLVVAKEYHEASARHRAAAKAKGPASSSSKAAARVDIGAVRAQMRADPAFAAAILASAAAEVSRPANVASAAPLVELQGPGGSSFSAGSALRTEALPGADSPAHAAPAAEAAAFMGPSEGSLASVLGPRAADPAATTPMEQGMEDQGPTRDLMKLLDEFSRR